MATRKNTAGAQDSRQTSAAVDQAEAQKPDMQGGQVQPEGAAAPSGPEQETSEGNDPAAPEAGAAAGGGLRAATATSPIAHDGETYRPGDLVPLTAAGFTALQPTGALAETSWDDCAEV